MDHLSAPLACILCPFSLGTSVATWEFVLADVSQPLFGADFFCTSGLMVDLKGHRLIDTTTYDITPLSRFAQVGPHISIMAVKADGPFADYWESFL